MHDWSEGPPEYNGAYRITKRSKRERERASKPKPEPFWNDVRVAQLTKLWNDGMQFRLIMKTMGITRGQLTGKVDRLGLAARGMSNTR